MKIQRFLSAGREHLGRLHDDGRTTLLEGDLFAGLRDTGAPATVDKLLAPLLPRDILCVGLNYKQHAAESGAEPPAHPVLFMKNAGTLQNPGDPIMLPRKLRSDEVDYECELAVVIGKRCHNVGRADALKHVLGYTCANDVSARDWQRNGGGGQWCRGKTFATFCPLGPALVTTDEITDPNRLAIKTILNGQTLQDWNTGDMIFDVPTLIEFLSASMILEAGTVILTGTPHGVGFARKPPVFLKAGDSVTIEIEGIGRLTNPVEEKRPGERRHSPRFPGRRPRDVDGVGVPRYSFRIVRSSPFLAPQAPVPKSQSSITPNRGDRSRLSKTVLSRLSQAIKAGEFEPGSRISEPTLSEMLGVSRAPIREALVELEMRGLVEFDPTGHTRIPALTPQDIEEIYAVRLMIDPMAAGLAAERGKEKDFAAMEANITATKQAKTLADVSRLDAEFHDRIVHAAGNRRLLACWTMLRDQFTLWLTQMQLRRQAVTHRTRQDTVDTHRALLEVIRSGDAKKATDEGRRHVAGWIKLMPKAK